MEVSEQVSLVRPPSSVNRVIKVIKVIKGHLDRVNGAKGRRCNMEEKKRRACSYCAMYLIGIVAEA